MLHYLRYSHIPCSSLGSSIGQEHCPGIGADMPQRRIQMPFWLTSPRSPWSPHFGVSISPSLISVSCILEDEVQIVRWREKTLMDPQTSEKWIPQVSVDASGCQLPH